MGALFFYLFIALFVSFVCSLAEAILLTTPQSYLVTQKDKDSWANSILNYKKNIDKPLSAILSLNTVAHTIGAAGVGAQATALFGETSLGLISAALTVLILIISEIIPKTIGAIYWKRFVKPTLYAIQFMMIITYPLVVMSMKVTQLFSKQKNASVSREEIAALANMGYDEGVFSMQEKNIIQNILNLKQLQVTEIMTPRVVVISAEETITIEQFKSQAKYLNFSRIPLFSNQNETITGYVFLQDVLEKATDSNAENTLLRSMKREILTIPNTISIFGLFNKLIEKKEHIAIVVDEYGGLDGIVTMEDIIETLLGLEIIDEKDKVIDMQKYAKEKWQKKHRS